MNHNPKLIQAEKDGKARMERLVYSCLAGDAAVHSHGADKYGERNWRAQPILASTYEGAILRHFLAWAQGEDIDPDSGWHHFYHIRACCAVVLDSIRHGTLTDDRGRVETVDPDTKERIRHDSTGTDQQPDNGRLVAGSTGDTEHGADTRPWLADEPLLAAVAAVRGLRGPDSGRQSAADQHGGVS